MKIKILKAVPVSFDGVKVIQTEKGQELQAPDELAQMLIDAEFAEEVKEAPAKADKEPKDKK